VRADEISLVDEGSYERDGIPHAALAWLRANSPVYWHPGEGPGQPGFWAVTKHRDVEYVSRHPGLFSSYRRLALFSEMPDEDIETHRLMMLNMDPPRHTRQRGFVSRVFTPKAVSQMEADVTRICSTLLDEVAPRGEADFVRDIAAPLPLHVLCELMGVPAQDRPRLFRLSNQLAGYTGDEFVACPATRAADLMRDAALEYYLYANDLAMRRRAAPCDDIVTRLLGTDGQGESLTTDEFDMLMLMLAVAGTETTRNAAAGGMLAFFEHPAQWRRLLNDPGLSKPAAEEVVRWVSPVNLFRRTATRDTEIGGQPVAEGDKVVIFYSSANRDEDVFAEPETFDIGRDPNPHLGFGGGGPHFCLGRHLAVLELRVLFALLAERMPDIAPAGQAVRHRSNFTNGINQLPVCFAARARVG
jgi:cholest-4-en-3-one 26-monooxygenase